MRRSSGVRIVAMVALVSRLAVTTWGTSARAAQPDSTAKTVSGTVSCPIAKQALQLYAFAYRPSLGYAAALISTGPAGTPATTELVGAQTDKSNYVPSSACSRAKVSVRFTHRGSGQQESSRPATTNGRRSTVERPAGSSSGTASPSTPPRSL